jgi:hypothetical protein
LRAATAPVAARNGFDLHVGVASTTGVVVTVKGVA